MSAFPSSNNELKAVFTSAFENTCGPTAGVGAVVETTDLTCPKCGGSLLDMAGIIERNSWGVSIECPHCSAILKGTCMKTFYLNLQ